MKNSPVIWRVGPFLAIVGALSIALVSFLFLSSDKPSNGSPVAQTTLVPTTRPPTVTVPAPVLTPTVVLTTTPVTTQTSAPLTPTATITMTPVSTPTIKPAVVNTATATPTIVPSPTFTAIPTAVPATPTIALTATWRIFENQEHGFRIRHTPTFTSFVIPGHTGAGGSELLYEAVFYDHSKYKIDSPQEFPKLILQVISNPQRMTIDAWAKAHLVTTPGAENNSFLFFSYESVRSLRIAGVQASRIAVTSAYDHKIQRIMIPHPREAKIVSLSYFMDPSSLEPLFEAMASTLELTR